MVDVAHGTPPTRPPTPPKENVEEAAKLPTDHSYQGTLGQQILLDTPDESPSSSSDYFASSSGKLHKRVVFSPWTKYHNPTYATDNAALLDAKLRPLPPSKNCIALHKSILKASAEKNSPPFHNLQPLVLDPDQGLAVMLQSVTQRLTRASRDLRLDTYKALLGCMAAYDNVPATQTLVNNLAGFLDIMRRDIIAKQPGTATFDVELVTSALKSLSAMICMQGLVDVMPDEFCTFVAEQAISSIEHQDKPKIMVDHYMQLLGRQKLPQRIINTDRLNRLLTALDGLEYRLKGNRVIGLKIMIYQRILLQAKNLLVGRVGQWFPFLISCMSSSIKDIRIRAIAFGTDAALAFGTTAVISQSCLDLLNTEIPSGAKVVDSLGSRMLELLNDRDGAIHVPQIWSVIILFLRSRRHQIERWEHLTSWFGIIQRCFNSSDVKIKRQANIAWNRLVSSVSLDTSTSLSMIKMLREPIAAQLERKSSDKHLKNAKQVARSSYCNLLYHAFRPGSPLEQLDLYWDNFVIPVLSFGASSTKSDHEFACQVLAASLSSPQPRLWDQNRAQDASLLIKPEELPCLDPKWVRLRAATIITMLEKLLLASCAQLDSFQEAPFFDVWRSFTKALGDAASKEIKVSIETMAAFAQITSMLNRYWHRKSDTIEEAFGRLEVYIALINETSAKVGIRPFLEKRLLFDPSGITFEAAETPSNRLSHSWGILNTPIMYILAFLVSDSHGIETSALYEKAIYQLLTIALHAASSRRNKLALLRQLAIDILSRPYVTISSRLVFWNCLARETERALSVPPSETPASDITQYPGQDYRHCMLLLEMGFQEFGNGLYLNWKTLTDVVVRDIKAEIGEAGLVLVYTEPLARVILESIKSSSDICLRYGSYIVKQARWPTSRKELERARKQLWGPGSNVSKDASFDSFDHLYSMVVGLLNSAYSNLQPTSLDVAVELISSVSSFLRLCPLSMKAVCLKRMQQGLAVWIEDANTVVSRIDETRTSGTLSSAVKTLWKVVADTLGSVARPDSNLLGMLQDLLVAGFRSRHRHMVNTTIMMWNHTFAKADILDYPPALRLVLTKLRPTVDIELPGFGNDDVSEIMSSPFNFVESQEDENDVKVESAAAKASRRLIASELHNTSHSRKTAIRSPGTPSARASRRDRTMTPKARLRHDNSQLQFAAIESSPLNSESGETQHLTNHQKETKERQGNDAAAMFKDIRSSPRILRSAKPPLELVLHKTQTSGKPLDVDAEPSPTFPPGDATMNEFLGSSPTPRSSSRISVDHQFNDNSGSSPLNSPIAERRGRPANIHSLLKTGNSPKPTSIAVENVIQPPEVSDPASLAPPTVQNTLENNKGSFNSASNHKTPIVHEPIQNPEQRSPTTAEHAVFDSQVFVDASADLAVDKAVDNPEDKYPEDKTSPYPESHVVEATPKPVTPRSHKDTRNKAAATRHTNGGSIVEKIEDSFCAEQPSTPTEDELVREQLLRDLEEASSQAGSQVPKRRPSLSSPSEASRKRKILANASTKPRKKARQELPLSSQIVEVVVEKRSNNHEYFIIDDRPAAGTGRLASPASKRKRSPSPSKSCPPSSSKGSSSKNTSARRRTRSMAGCTSLQPSELVDGTTTSAPNAQSDANNNFAATARIEQHSRKRQRSEPFQEKFLEGSNERSNQGDDPLHISDAASLQEPATEMNDISSSQIEGIKHVLLSTGDTPLEAHETSSALLPSSSSGGDTIPNTPCDDAQQAQQASPAQTTGRSPGQRMLDRFKSLLNDLKHITLWPAEEKEMMKVALEVVGGVHEAGFRRGRHGE
ncbi:MAG: hypothetical protein Q9209_001874 [Squamulea sp. 1 TL-2023]